MKISILINNHTSWMWDYIYDFQKKLNNLGFEVLIYKDNEELKNGGELAFFLGCTKIVPKELLKYHKFNFVIHHSDLPKGRGSSPLVWQIIEGKDDIVFSMFDAKEKVDTGKIFIKDVLKLNGTELLDEIFYKRWIIEQKMILNLLEKYPNIMGVEQIGEPTFYRRRNEKDDELNISKSIEELMNELRIHDNDKWPAYFYYKGNKYILKIYKDKLI